MGAKWARSTSSTNSLNPLPILHRRRRPLRSYSFFVLFQNVAVATFQGNSNGDKRTRGTGANKPKYYVSLEACLRIFEEGMISKWKAWVLGAFILAMGSAIGLVQYSFSNESKSLR